MVGRECKASKAIVLEGEGYSIYDSKFYYKPGITVIPDSYDLDIRVECTSGIHFLLLEKKQRTIE